MFLTSFAVVALLIIYALYRAKTQGRMEAKQDAQEDVINDISAAKKINDYIGSLSPDAKRKLLKKYNESMPNDKPDKFDG